jgi:mRNA-degrading endonuclease toxin of MazEF toxin-antitoxin module
MTIPIAAMDRRVTTLSAERMDEVGRAIKFALALD